MKWNLRLAAANRGIWKASELQQMLADVGMVISTGKMSGLWSGNPASWKGEDLDAICAVLGCGVDELLIPEAPPGRRETTTDQTRAVGGGPGGASGGEPSAGSPATSSVVPRRRDGRSLPPV